jgi:hypothetical protein
MPLGLLAHTHLPYCVQREEDGGYVVLNRDYKPLGFNTKEHLDYGNYPISVRFSRLLAVTAAKISVHGKGDLDVIYLYDDGTIPTESAANMTAYLKRLAVLNGLKVSDSRVR